MKMKIIFIALLGLAATVYSQSLLTITNGASLTVTTGADICADSIIGTIQGGGTICGGPNSIESEEGNLIPDKFALEQNYPNPFNPSTKIRYSIPRSAEYYSVPQNVTLKVYDVLGNEVVTLVNEEKPAGVYEVEFSAGTVGNASGLTSGVYFYRLQAGSFTKTNKMILMR